MKKSIIRFGLWAMLCGLAAGTAQAVPVRIASFNVKTGIDTDHYYGTTNVGDYAATIAILQRVQPDIVCFQELYANEANMTAWLAAAAVLDYSYYAISDGGTFDTTLRLGVWSKYPITGSAHVKETVVDTNAAEITRWPLHVTIEVPGALYPFHVFVTHNKATTENTKTRFQRAFEIHRTVNYITNLVAQDPNNNVEYAIMGDFNDDIGLAQNSSFDLGYYNSVVGSLSGFNDGYDIPWNNPTNAGWLMLYSKYPTERLAAAGMAAVDAAHTGTNLTWTHYAANPASRYRLDYILFSEEIMNSAYGAPAGEVYNSEGDGEGVGLPKAGSPLAFSVSSNASDHRLIFSDFHLIDAVAGVTPVGIISEVVDHSLTNGTYVEICNTGSSDLDLTGYELGVYLNGSTNSTKIALSGTVAGGGTHLIATSASGCVSNWGVTPDQTAGIIGSLNGNDTVALFKPNGSLSDVYGQIGAVPGAWGFTNSVAMRKPGVSDPLPIWLSAEWTITAGTNTATPGAHQALSDADGYVADIGLDPPVPRATNSFAITASAYANQLASNLAATAYFRISGGAWFNQPMTNSGATWRTPMMFQAISGGDVMEYYVELAFDGPGSNSPQRSPTQNYTFPVGTGTVVRVTPLFNEIQANGNSTDTNEFIELIAPAGTNLVGYTLKQYNGAPGIQSNLWTYTFPSFVVTTNDNIYDRASNHLGLVVISQNSNNVANTDLLLGHTLNNGPNALILCDPSNRIVDAVVWLTSPTNTFDTDVDDPGTVSRLVPSGSPTYLHVIGVDQDTDSCPQAPNAVLTTTDGWYSATATPGALNAQQTSGALIVCRLDLDGDGVLDDEDNCPDSFNPTQSDNDHDGIGDTCDPDRDGDGWSNEVDNCPDDPNASQSDMDEDGIGDGCDPDIDGDGVPNEEDPFPYEPSTWTVDFEDASKITYAYAVTTVNDREWGLSNALIGTSFSDLRNGSRSLRFRAPGEWTLQGKLTNGLGNLSFAYGRYGSDDGATLTAEYDSGEGWVEIASVSTLGVASLATNTTAVNVIGPVDFRVTCTGSADTRVNLDDVLISSFTLPSDPQGATCTLAATNEAVYDGQAHTNTFYVSPVGMPFSVVYSPTNPVDAGTYSATVTIPDIVPITGGTFVFTDSVVIAQADATCTLDAPLLVDYDGQPHTNDTFTVTPGLAWSVAYAPSDPPVAVGVYDATVTVVSNANWHGGVFIFSNAVTISEAPVGPPAAPDSLWASATNVADFTAEWSAVAGATSYRLDVGTNALFGGGSGGGSIYAVDFEEASKGSYAAGDVDLNGLSWNLNEALIGTTAGSDRFNGTKSARVRSNETANSTGVMSMNDDTNMGLSSITLLHAKYGTDAATAGRVDYSTNGGASWISAGTFDVTSTNLTLFSATNLNVAGNVRVRVAKTSGTTARYNVDDIVLYPLSPLSSYVPGYSNRTVSGTSMSVTGLTAGVTYYFRVQAVSAGGTGTYSTVADVATRLGTPPVLHPISAQTATVNVDFDYTVGVTTTELDTVTFGCVSAVTTNWLFDEVSGYFYFLPEAFQVGANVFTFTASDKDGEAAPVAMTVMVYAATASFEDWVVGKGLDPGSSNFALDADYDGDGMVTYEEYLADTDPAASGSVLRLTGTYFAVSVSNPVTGQIRLSFPASTGRYYQLIYRTNLFSPTLTNDLGQGVPGMVVTNDSPGAWFGDIRVTLEMP